MIFVIIALLVMAAAFQMLLGNSFGAGFLFVIAIWLYIQDHLDEYY
jgi:predicted alpha/beta superfamily hydrolase